MLTIVVVGRIGFRVVSQTAPVGGGRAVIIRGTGLAGSTAGIGRDFGGESFAGLGVGSRGARVLSCAEVRLESPAYSRMGSVEAFSVRFDVAVGQRTLAFFPLLLFSYYLLVGRICRRHPMRITVVVFPSRAAVNQWGSARRTGRGEGGPAAVPSKATALLPWLSAGWACHRASLTGLR